MANQPLSAAPRESAEVQAYFYDLADRAIRSLDSGEVLTISFDGEDSSFVRINRAKVRQPGEVRQQYLSVDLIHGSKHARGAISLSGVRESDAKSVDELLRSLRGHISYLPEDPYLLYATEIRNTEVHGEDKLPDAAETVRSILVAAQARDLVGIWASGGIYSGFANSLGQRNCWRMARQ